MVRKKTMQIISHLQLVKKNYSIIINAAVSKALGAQHQEFQPTLD